jgi:4-amino-4-deoxy-L-arabinose transferase-like glycosyltransferase
MGPATFYWLGLFFRIFGTHFAVARSLVLLTGAVTVFLLYWMTRRLCREPFDLVPAIFVLLMSIPLWPASNHHWDSNLFALLAIASFFLWQDTGRTIFVLLSGIAAGLTSCFMAQKGLLVLLALLTAEFVNGFSKGSRLSREFLIRLSLLVIGYGSVGSLALLYFYWVGALPDLLYATLIWPLSHYQQVNVVPYGHGLLEFLWPAWRSVLEAFLPVFLARSLAIVFVIPFILVLALPFLVGLLGTLVGLSRQIRGSLFSARILPYWTAGVALWLSEIHRLDTEHLIYGSPMILVLLLFLWTTYCQSRQFLKVSGIAFILVSLGLFGAFNVFVAVNASQQQSTRRGSVRLFAEDTALKFLHEEVKQGDSVFVYPYYPMYYFLADVRNPTRHSILMYHINTKAQFNEVILDLEQKKVNYVLWDTVVEGARLSIWFPGYRHPPNEKLRLERYFETHYRVIGVKGGFKILRRTTN